MASPRCRACSHPLRDSIDAELQAGLSIRQVARVYGLSLGGSHRHLAHMERGASPGAPSTGLETADAQVPVLTDSAPSGGPGRLQRGPGRSSSTGVDVAERLRVPKVLQRILTTSSNIPDHRLERAVADVKRLEDHLADLAAPIADVVVTDGRPGLYADWHSRIFDEKGGYEPGY